ncbi:MAG: tetratricopeptide repeat protein [Oligoflexia bacterium]|nr:tetratricopeptide repeat protein [Oligoflexia bacterium]
MKKNQAHHLVKVNFFLLILALVGFYSCNANNPDTKFRLAEKLATDKKYKAAINEFETLVSKDPNSKIGIQSQLRIAEIQNIFLGQFKDSIDSYKKYLEKEKDEQKKREALKILANLYFQNSDQYDEALESFSQLINYDLNQKEAEEWLFKVGRSLYLKTKFQESIEIHELLKRKFPNGDYFCKAELEIANNLSTNGKCKDSFSRFENVLKCNDEKIKPLATFGIASCLEENDELDKAYEVFQSIVETYPSTSVVELKMQRIKRRKILRKR